jgi:glutamate/tyrosine decarboxylase-like PLP-dependent enzyme
MQSFRTAIDRGFAQAEFVEARLRGMPGWEIVIPAHMGIVCFRYSSADDAAHLRLVQSVLQDGFALITSTVLKHRTVLRTCTINPRTTNDDIDQSLKRLDALARALK